MAVWWAQFLDCMGGRGLGSKQTQNTHGTMLCWDIEGSHPQARAVSATGAGKKRM